MPSVQALTRINLEKIIPVTSSPSPMKESAHQSSSFNPNLYKFSMPSWGLNLLKEGISQSLIPSFFKSHSPISKFHQTSFDMAKLGSQIYAATKILLWTHQLDEEEAVVYLSASEELIHSGLTLMDVTYDGKIIKEEIPMAKKALEQMSRSLLSLHLRKDIPFLIRGLIETLSFNEGIYKDLNLGLNLPSYPVNKDLKLDDPSTYPFLKFYYLNEASQVSAVQTDKGYFRDDISETSHIINNYDKKTGMQPIVAPSPPSVTTYRNADWMTWREGNRILARMVGWGPSHVRVVREAPAGSNITQDPQVANFNGQLVVVWGENNQLQLSHADYGLYWSDPVAYPGGQEDTSKISLVVHKNKLYVGIVKFNQALLRLIDNDFKWGPDFNAVKLNQEIIGSSIGLASNGKRLSLAYAYSIPSQGQRIEVIHTEDVINFTQWTQPSVIDTNISVEASPSIYYFGDYLYAVYPSVSMYLMVRSLDGFDWNVPRFIVATLTTNSTQNSGVLVSSTYPINAPQPILETIHDSGNPPSKALDVVVLSEGYLESELPTFQATAQKILGAYQGLNPFSRLMGHINFYSIKIPSREKGINISPLLGAAIRKQDPNFPEVRQTDTAFDSSYYVPWKNHTAVGWSWQMSDISPAYSYIDPAEDDYKINEHIETDGQKDIAINGYYTLDVVKTLIPGFDPHQDIVYVIVERDDNEGGYVKDSVMPFIDEPKIATDLTDFHEFGHARASLQHEETCLQDLANFQTNLTTNGDLTDPNHPWAHFFVPGESIVATPKGTPPYSMDDFWDHNVVNGSKVFNVGLWSAFSTTCSNVYGPSHQCIMNHTGGTTRFDAVCTEEITKAIDKIAGVPFNDQDYHHNSNQVRVEYEHSRNGPDISPPPKDGFLFLNGIPIPASQYHCTYFGLSEVCSVDVSNALIQGANELVFKRIPEVNQGIILDTIQVVNGNGAPLPIYPQSDLTNVGTTSYNMNFMSWGFDKDLEFKFTYP